MDKTSKQYKKLKRQRVLNRRNAIRKARKAKQVVERAKEMMQAQANPTPVAFRLRNVRLRNRLQLVEGNPRTFAKVFERFQKFMAPHDVAQMVHNIKVDTKQTLTERLAQRDHI